jgi:hypothetical protein
MVKYWQPIVLYVALIAAVYGLDAPVWTKEALADSVAKLKRERAALLPGKSVS